MGARAARLRTLLPSLYRPRPASEALAIAGVDDLLARFLDGLGQELDRLDRSAAEVANTHWWPQADRGLYHPALARRRQLRGQAVPQSNDRLALVDATGFNNRLRAAGAGGLDPVTTDLRARLTAQTRAALDGLGPGEPLPARLQRALIGELDDLLSGPSIFDPARYAAVELSVETRALADLSLAGSGLAGAELERLNRRLLVETFSGQLTRADLDHPYFQNLSRLASLLGLRPRLQPAAWRDSAEGFRRRTQRTVDLYRHGLGTLAALRGAVEAALPADPELPPSRRERPFFVEEHSPGSRHRQAAQGRLASQDLVAPLMRWRLTNDGLNPVPATLYIEGVEARPGEVDATVRPMIELYDGGAGRPPVGLGFGGDLAPGETLRVRPGFVSWVAVGDGIRSARSLPTDVEDADPTVSTGRWRRPDGSPVGMVVDLYQSHDRVLWAALEVGAGGELWRGTPDGWQRVLADLPTPRRLAELGNRLLLATAEGLRTVALYPPSGEPFAVSPVAGSDSDVRDLAAANGGGYWLATANGVERLGADGTVRPIALAGTPLSAVIVDGVGDLYCGGELGLFLRQGGESPSEAASWWWYAGGEPGDDWRPFELDGEGRPAALPDATAVFLPAVRTLHRAADGSLWIGTDQGPARYLATAGRGATFETRLEAFPDLADGAVNRTLSDRRGLVWHATDRGLVGFDGRDAWQRQGSALLHLGRVDTLLGEDLAGVDRGAWRFDRATGAWQQLSRAAGWQAKSLDLRGRRAIEVRALIFTQQAVADLGAWDGEVFTQQSSVGAERLVMRLKPTPERIVAGGWAALPELPRGDSEWRFLRVEGENPDEPAERPAWTAEGRLLAPPVAADPLPGRHSLPAPPDSSLFDRAVFSYCPAARVSMSWRPAGPLSVTVRLKLRQQETALDPALIDWAWQAIEQARPAGVRVRLALEGRILRGNNDENTD